MYAISYKLNVSVMQISLIICINLFDPFLNFLSFVSVEIPSIAILWMQISDLIVVYVRNQSLKKSSCRVTNIHSGEKACSCDISEKTLTAIKNTNS